MQSITHFSWWSPYHPLYRGNDAACRSPPSTIQSLLRYIAPNMPHTAYEEISSRIMPTKGKIQLSVQSLNGRCISLHALANSTSKRGHCCHIYIYIDQNYRTAKKGVIVRVHCMLPNRKEEITKPTRPPSSGILHVVRERSTTQRVLFDNTEVESGSTYTIKYETLPYPKQWTPISTLLKPAASHT